MDTRVTDLLNELLSTASDIIDPDGDKYPLKYVSPAEPPTDCSLLVAFWYDGPTPRPTEGRRSGVMYEIELRLRLADCCVPGGRLEDGTFVLPSPENMTAFTNGFDTDVMSLWGGLSQVKKEMFGRYGFRCDDPITVLRPSEARGLCFHNDLVWIVPIIPVADCG